MLKHFLFLPGCVAICTCIHAQDSLSGPSLSFASAGNAIDIYEQPVDRQARLYNGIEHHGYSYKIRGFAYFNDPVVEKGRIVYDDLEYTDVPMWYDLVRDQVVVRHFNRFTRIGLISEKVKEFSLAGHHFIRMQIDSLSRSPLTTGFYELLYDGKTQALAKYIKVIDETVKDEVERDFSEHRSYYLKKDGSWHSVKNSKGLVAIFRERSKEVKQYLRKNKIRYKNNPIQAIVKAAAYYDSLNQ